ncbi:MAG: M20/M25/M40 family metallo-hydrolase [Alphaproteobacteria bacterium]|nr:M20/M25/M40 family metallo-hydrolase [Alphaproteobacteria bacterium]
MFPAFTPLRGPELELTQRLVQIPSLTPTQPDLLDAVGEALRLCQAAAPSANAYWVAGRDTNPSTRPVFPYEVPNLVLVWGNPQQAGGLCFLGHVDVVPVAKQTWQRNPFGGEIADGILWGRGATDMKGAVAAFLVAAEAVFLQRPERPIYAVITGDEEWGSPAGTLAGLQTLHELGAHPAAFLVGEPSSQQAFGTGLKLGRRGSFNLALTLRGQSGHVAYPALFSNPLEHPQLGPLIGRLATLAFADGNPPSGMPATRATLTSVVADGGSTSIVPASAEMRLNFRYTPQQTPEGLWQQVAALVAEMGLAEWVTITANLAVGRHQNPYLNQPGPLHQALVATLTDLVGAPPRTDAEGGLTDGRHVHKVFPGAEVVECGPPEQPYGAGGMHQADEGIRLDDLANLRHVYQQVMKAL